jgi:hypothetical protein
MGSKLLAERASPTSSVSSLRIAHAPLRASFNLGRRRGPLGKHHDRGQPIERYDREALFERNRAGSRGRVIEIGDGKYARHYGGERVICSDVPAVRWLR